MRQIFMILGILFFCSHAYAEEGMKKDSYEQGFWDGGVYALILQYELDINSDYNMLKELESQKNESIRQIREYFVRSLNAKLETLGHVIEDMDNKKIFSPRFFEFMKEKGEMMTKNTEKKIGKEKYAKLKGSFEGLEVFWKRLKREREQNNWKIEIKNEEIRTLYEKYVGLALDTYCQYGNAFKIEESP